MLRLCHKYGFADIRVYTNMFSLANQKWLLQANLLTPKLALQKQTAIKTKQGSGLLFSIIQTTKKFNKGEKALYFILRHEQIFKLACWNGRYGPFEWISNNKSVMLQRVPNSKIQEVRMVFFHKNEEQQNKIRQFRSQKGEFQLLQKMLMSGFFDFGQMRQQQLSTIGTVIKEIKSQP